MDSIPFNLNRSESLCQQIAQHIRSMVASGELPLGSQLPATHALAATWKTAPRTVHRALVALETEGIVSRRHGIGTFIRKRDDRLTCVGIYLREDILANRSSDFQRTVYALVKDELNRQGIRTQVWIDPRSVEEQSAPLTELCRAVDLRQIQALIVPAVGSQIEWLKKLPIPSAFATSADIPNKVDVDIQQLAEWSLPCLAEQGCRSVGFLGTIYLSVKSAEDRAHNTSMLFLDRFSDLAAKLGLAIKNEWIRIPNAANGLEGNMLQEQFGYEEVIKLLNLSNRPEGLVVYPDTTARGVILGLREKQVRVPDDLKLVIHKNESIPVFCPMPATFVVLSEREYALALIAQVQKQFRGELCKPIMIAHTLLPAEKAGKRS